LVYVHVYLIDNIRAIERSADVLFNACKYISLAVNIGKLRLCFLHELFY
jgi:hypothetical protein